MSNSKAAKDAMETAKLEMLAWPKWYFRFQMWRHRNGPFARMLRETGAAKIISDRMVENEKRRKVEG